MNNTIFNPKLQQLFLNEETIVLGWELLEDEKARRDVYDWLWYDGSICNIEKLQYPLKDSIYMKFLVPNGYLNLCNVLESIDRLKERYEKYMEWKDKRDVIDER